MAHPNVPSLFFRQSLTFVFLFLDRIVVFVLSVFVSTVLRSGQCAGIRISLFIFTFLTAIGSSEGGGGGAFDGKVCLIEEGVGVDVLSSPDVVIVVELVEGVGRLGEVLADVSS